MADAAAYADWIVKNQDRRGTPEFETVAKAYQAARQQPTAAQPTAGDLLKSELLGSVPGAMLRGVKDVIDTGAQLAASGFDKLTGGGEGDRVRAMNEAGKAEFDAATGGAIVPSVARVGGNIIGTLPLTAAAGAGLGAAGMTRLGQAVASGGMTTGAAPLNMLARAGDLGIRTLGGGISGGIAAGAVNPDDAVTGAGIGAALPGLLKVAGGLGSAAGGAVRRMTAPLSAANDEAALGEFLRGNLGQYTDEAITNLRRATQQGPTMLPGYQPTAAEVAGVPSLAALQRTATAVDPGAMNQLGEIARRNQEVIAGSLDDLAGRGGMRDFFAADRSAVGKQLYEQAFSAPASQNLTSGLKGEITKLLKRPDIQEAKKVAQRLAQNEGAKFKDGSIQGMHYMKLALDDAIGSAGQRGIGAAERNALIANRDRLVGLIENLSPDYAQARAAYSAMSRPVNQMDVLERIATGATNARGNVTLNSLARNMTDKVAQSATGMRNATLESALDPQQLARLNAIRDALQGVDFAQTAGRGVGSDTVQKLATSQLVPGWSAALSNIPGMGVIGGLASRGADAIYGAANQRMSNALANALLDPAQTLAILEAQRAMNPLAVQASRAAPIVYRAAPVVAAQ